MSLKASNPNHSAPRKHVLKLWNRIALQYLRAAANYFFVLSKILTHALWNLLTRRTWKSWRRKISSSPKNSEAENLIRFQACQVEIFCAQSETLTGLSPSTSVFPVSITPPLLHTQLHTDTTLIRRTSGIRLKNVRFSDEATIAQTSERGSPFSPSKCRLIGWLDGWFFWLFGCLVCLLVGYSISQVIVTTDSCLWVTGFKFRP